MFRSLYFELLPCDVVELGVMPAPALQLVSVEVEELLAVEKLGHREGRGATGPRCPLPLDSLVARGRGMSRRVHATLEDVRCVTRKFASLFYFAFSPTEIRMFLRCCQDYHDYVSQTLFQKACDMLENFRNVSKSIKFTTQKFGKCSFKQQSQRIFLLVFFR